MGSTDNGGAALTMGSTDNGGAALTMGNTDNGGAALTMGNTNDGKHGRWAALTTKSSTDDGQH